MFTPQFLIHVYFIGVHTRGEVINLKLLDSGIDNQMYDLYDLENILKRLDFVIGGNWDYDHAYFDYELDKDTEKYVFLRIPVSTEIGYLDERDAKVRLGKPFVLAHRFESGIDQQGTGGNVSAGFNQFASPEDEDAEVDATYIQEAERVLQQVERALLQ
ncbi:YugN-like family protein [Piscibacillus halophilus]|uniref:YugN-like family protein n=1 Tax=Piscibacillus halophilus TaxID=571933 RepID=A0A1H9JJA2_9BACI|nr:YugN-like family protein [Piscibacillus halophilus]